LYSESPLLKNAQFFSHDCLPTNSQTPTLDKLYPLPNLADMMLVVEPSYPLKDKCNSPSCINNRGSSAPTLADGCLNNSILLNVTRYWSSSSDNDNLPTH